MIVAEVYCPECNQDVLATAHHATNGFNAEQARCPWCDTIITLTVIDDPALD